jgi:DNA topoisomerase I
MTDRELRLAFQRLDSKPDLLLVDAGKCRHELDWLYGINLSRLLTESTLKQRRGYVTLSTGRVQGPTLGFVVKREEEISCFVPIPFWTVNATIVHDGKTYALEYEKDKVATQSEAKTVCDDCREALLEVNSIESHEIQQYSPYPFDLSTLQAEAYRHFGFSPARTLALAERLYLDALISYPRTSSQKLPPDIGYIEILGEVGSNPEYRSLVAKLTRGGHLRPNNGPKDDPAHPAIYPTGESAKGRLFGPEAKLYDLISRRFIATFADPSLKTSSRMTFRHKTYRFFISGSRITQLGWIEFYRPYVFEDSRPLPELKTGDRSKVHDIKAFEKFTQPPHRYNPSSLLKKMEDTNIGTKATRAGIIDLLYTRGYVKGEHLKASELANKVTEVLTLYCPLIIEPSFTANLENLMQDMQKGTSSRRRVLVDALQHLRSIMLSLAEKEDDVGSQLSEVIVTQRVADATFDTPCPKCGLKLAVIRSHGTGKRFIGCNGKWENGCNFTLPLPQFGTLALLPRLCNICGFQMIQARSKGRRPLVSCPRCYTTKTTDAKSSSTHVLAPSRVASEIPRAT